MTDDSCCNKIQCGSVWGGIKNTDQDIETSGLKASLFSHSFEGGKGGDIYYFSVCQGDVLTRVVVADVVGHGEAVSQTSEFVYNELLRQMNNPDGSQILSEWNKNIESCGIAAMTTAVIAGIVAKGNNLFYTYAGHHPLLFKRKSSDTWQKADAKTEGNVNLPLGIDVDSSFEQKEDKVSEGDKFFLVH